MISLFGFKMSTLEVSKFDGNGDFRLWQVKMQPVLVDKGLDITLEEVDSDLASISKEELKTIDKKALAALCLALVDNVLRQVCEGKSAKALWKKLEPLYLDKSVSSRFYIMMRLFRMRMQEGTPIKQYIDEFNKAVLDYQNVVNSIDTDHLPIFFFLCSLPNSYDSIRDQILYGIDSIGMDDITFILLSKDLLKKSRMESNGQSESLVVSRGRSIKHGHSGGDASGSGRRKSKGRSKSRSGNKGIQCRYCKDFGHFKWDCPKLKKKRVKQGDGSKGENSSTSSVAVADGDQLGLVSYLLSVQIVHQFGSVLLVQQLIVI